MSPIDDELRSALRARATAVAPAADPFPGVERRARRIRRTRAASAVAGSALAVAAVAVAVPALTPDRTDRPGGFASQQPSATAAPYALDPANPWEYRGDPAVLGNGGLETLRREWQTRHPGSTLEPLFGQVYEPSQVGEVVFVAHGSGPARYGLVKADHGGEFEVDEPLPSGAEVVAVAVDGDEVPRIVAVAAPGTTLHYAGDGTVFAPMAALADGVGTIGLEGDQARDKIAVRDAQGNDVAVVDAPDHERSGTEPQVGMPANVVDWPGRGGEAAEGLVAEAVAAYARSREVAPESARVASTLLFAGSDDAGKEYLLAQMWLPGDRLADTVGYVRRPDGEPELQLQSPAKAADIPAFAMVVAASPGQEVDTLVVVPRPQTGQVEYAADGRSYRPVNGAPGLDGVVLVDRAKDASSDRLRLLDGHGTPYFEGAVAELVCGVKECG